MAVVVKRLLSFCWSALLVLLPALSSCDAFSYGTLGGADKTEILKPGSRDFDTVMSAMSGVWYSHYAGIGRLDGYRIGKWGDFSAIAGSKAAALFPNLVNPPDVYTGASFNNGDYFVLYDDTVYGQKDDGEGGNGGWAQSTRFAGIVRAVNIFNGDKERGAIIIEYLQGGAPQWAADIRDGQRPFFGIYYRELSGDIVQMANAVDLAALYAGKRYYTETATLEEAITKNTVENEAEFISWGVVIPQDRER
jgi:hypothetical protein